jgi:hypothetical protein
VALRRYRFIRRCLRGIVRNMFLVIAVHVARKGHFSMITPRRELGTPVAMRVAPTRVGTHT